MIQTASFHNRLVENLRRTCAGRYRDVEVIETHISSVLLSGDFAYKIKKPLNLGFLDFSTLERRLFCCREEVRLNGRLEPDIYLDVVPITGTLDDPEIGGGGVPIEYAVRMRRFSHDGLLANQVGSLTPALIDRIALRLAKFHGEVEVSSPGQGHGSPENLFRPMQQNIEQIRSLAREGTVPSLLQRIESWTFERHRELQGLEQRRIGEGYIRECHGDLHLGNMALDGGRLIIFDGIEFNPELRWIDTMSELAFLLMDLDEKGRPELARRLLDAYLQATGDYEGLRLLRFYQVYRAMVRAKVAAIRLHQEDLEPRERDPLHREFLAYLDQADGYTRPGSQTLLITHGLSGSGKSRGTGELLMQMPLVRIRSDVERKRLAGISQKGDSGSAPGEGIYTAEFSEKTYRRLLNLAREVMEAGYTLVVDAAFLKASQRKPFRKLAEDYGIPFLILDFQAPDEVLRERVRQRGREGTDASEADQVILERQIAGYEPLSAAESASALVVVPESPLTAANVVARCF